MFYTYGQIDIDETNIKQDNPIENTTKKDANSLFIKGSPEDAASYSKDNNALVLVITSGAKRTKKVARYGEQLMSLFADPNISHDPTDIILFINENRENKDTIFSVYSCGIKLLNEPCDRSGIIRKIPSMTSRHYFNYIFNTLENSSQSL